MARYSLFLLCCCCQIIWLSPEIKRWSLHFRSVHLGRQSYRKGRMSKSITRDTFVLTSKALLALIDCNSSLPEGRQCYRRQTAGESSFLARQTCRQIHIRWCATWGCLSLQDYWIKLCSQIFHLFKQETWHSMCVHFHIVFLFDTLHLVSWSTCPVALKWQDLNCLLIAMGLIKGALGMNNHCPRWGRNDVIDALY